MKESDLRKFHRYLGITLAFFLLLQGGSGLLISLAGLIAPSVKSDSLKKDKSDEHSGHSPGDLTSWQVLAIDEHQEDNQEDKHGVLGQIHHKEGTMWNFYRVLVGTGLIAMVFSGTAIFIKSQARVKNPRRNE